MTSSWHHRRRDEPLSVACTDWRAHTATEEGTLSRYNQPRGTLVCSAPPVHTTGCCCWWNTDQNSLDSFWCVLFQIRRLTATPRTMTRGTTSTWTAAASERPQPPASSSTFHCRRCLIQSVELRKESDLCPRCWGFCSGRVSCHDLYFKPSWGDTHHLSPVIIFSYLF